MAIDLAVASDGPTRRRLRRNLPAYGIAVHDLAVEGYVADLSGLAAVHSEYDVGFVFPTRIVEGAVLEAALGLPWVNDREAILTTRNKAASLAALQAGGVAIPRTVHVSAPADAEAVREAFRSFDGPVVLKPNATTRGVGHVRLVDEDSLRGVVDYLELIHAFPATADRSFLLQAYVPRARDLRLTLIDGTVVGAVERRRDDGWVKNVHRGATPVAVDPPPSVVEVAETAAALLDVRLLGVDVLLTEDGPLVLEVNGRPTIDRVERYPSTFYDDLSALIERVATGG
ncbi:MAG: RimK family alpha-L-glutamate ligase [Halobacteriales archaeon]